MDDFTRAYIECALWASTDEITGQPMDERYTIDDFDPTAISAIEADCTDFQQANAALIAEAKNIRNTYDDAKAGHDFWLTRNRHGAGYWDRGLGDVGEKLTAAAHVYGESYLFIDATNHVSVS